MVHLYKDDWFLSSEARGLKGKIHYLVYENAVMDIELTGSFPRPVLLNEKDKKFKQGKISEEDYFNSVKSSIKNLVAFLSSNRFSRATDGLLFYDDIVDVSFYYIKGIQKGELTRFYDNNFYYRTPIVKEALKADPQPFLRRLELSLSVFREVNPGILFKAAVLGPLTFAQLSENTYYRDKAEVALEYAHQLKKVIESISGKVSSVEIHEPALFSRELPMKIFSKTLDIYQTLGEVKAEKILISYFGFSLKRLETMLSLPVEKFGLDLISAKGNLAQIYRRAGGKKIVAGVVDSRNTKIERISSIKRIADNLKERSAWVSLANNTLMDFIPEIVAKRKLVVISKAGGA